MSNPRLSTFRRAVPAIRLLTLAAMLAAPLSAQNPAPAVPERPPVAGGGTGPAEKPAGDADEKAAREEMAKIEAIGWTREGVGQIGGRAEINVPRGLRFTGPSGAGKFKTMTGNLSSGDEQGILASEDFGWWSVFYFQDVGYVKDDEKDRIDADKILQTKREAAVEMNRERQKRGLETLELIGWAVPPFYNDQAKSLEWGIRIRSQSGVESVNYHTSLLGRRGVMEVTLVCGVPELEASLPELREALKGFSYREGESYAEFRNGDKIAEYGLTGLVVGGGAVLAAKTGLLAGLFKILAKGGKAVIALLVVIVAGIGKFFKRLFGRGA